MYLAREIIKLTENLPTDVCWMLVWLRDNSTDIAHFARLHLQTTTRSTDETSHPFVIHCCGSPAMHVQLSDNPQLISSVWRTRGSIRSNSRLTMP
jgi:hypothetical protein